MQSPSTFFVLFGGILASLACSVDPVDLSGKRCPCEEPFVCDDNTGVCVSPDQDASVGGNAGSSGASGSGAASGASGGGGISGTGGTGLGGFGGTAATGGGGGCLSTQKLCGGKCVSKTSSLYGCTATGCTPCGAFENATAVCKSSACSPLCKSGFGDCDKVASNGCESAVSDVANCGACGKACSTANASTTQCTNAKCAPVCNPGFGNCTTPSSTLPDNGCETNLNTSKSHCGGCGDSCTAGLTCANGRCGCSTSTQCEGLTGVKNAICNPATRLCSCEGKLCVQGEVCIKDTGTNRCSCGLGAACTAGQTCIDGKCV